MNERNDLLNQISRLFTLDELETICFELEIDFENIPGDIKDSKIRELISYCVRFGKLNLLLELCNQLRPHADWQVNTNDEEAIKNNRIVWHKDGKEMVLVTSGEFLWGEDKETRFLSDFYIDKYLVTNREFAFFVEKTGYRTTAEEVGYSYVRRRGLLDGNLTLQDYYGLLGRGFSFGWEKVNGANWQNPLGSGSHFSDLAKHPVVHVSWSDAQAYASWAEKLIPSKYEREKAARGTDGRKFPWGNLWRKNYCNSEESALYNTTPVGTYSPRGDSPYGCADMVGNVWEWVKLKSDVNMGKEFGIVGGSFDNAMYALLVTYHREQGYPHPFHGGLGFRLISKEKI